MARSITVTIMLASMLTLAACQRDSTPDAASGSDAGADTAAAGTESATAPEAGSPGAAQAGADGDESAISGSPPSMIPVPPADTPTPDIAAGAQITYTCEDGSELNVTYSGKAAKFALVDGSVVTLPRTSSGVKGGGDVYAGEAVALRRLGNVVEVDQGQGGKRVCAETSGTA